MTSTITFNIHRDALAALFNVAEKYGMTDFGMYEVEPMKVRTRVTVTMHREFMIALLEKTRQYLLEGHGYAPYTEAYRALYGHYPYRLPNVG